LKSGLPWRNTTTSRLTEAVDLLAQAVKTKPEARYLEAWALNWLEPAGAVESLSQTTAVRLFMMVLGHYSEASQLTLFRQREISRFAQLLERCHLPRISIRRAA